VSIKTELFDLSGRVALITGGTMGIGLSIAEAFVRHGARVVVASRDKERVGQAAERLSHIRDGAVSGAVMDVTDTASVGSAVQYAIEDFGGLHVVVNAAGNHLLKPTFDLSPEEYMHVMDVHAAGSLRVAQAAGKIFRSHQEGCIINIGSMSSYTDLMEITAYASAKCAVLGLTRSLANEWAEFGIRTNMIAPGFMPNETTRHLVDGTARGQSILKGTPLKRYGTGDEVGGAAVYLASEAGRFVNGSTLVVDGGFLVSGISDRYGGAS